MLKTILCTVNEQETIENNIECRYRRPTPDQLRKLYSIEVRHNLKYRIIAFFGILLFQK